MVLVFRVRSDQFAEQFWSICVLTTRGCGLDLPALSQIEIGRGQFCRSILEDQRGQKRNPQADHSRTSAFAQHPAVGLDTLRPQDSSSQISSHSLHFCSFSMPSISPHKRRHSTDDLNRFLLSSTTTTHTYEDARAGLLGFQPSASAGG